MKRVIVGYMFVGLLFGVAAYIIRTHKHPHDIHQVVPVESSSNIELEDDAGLGGK